MTADAATTASQMAGLLFIEQLVAKAAKLSYHDRCLLIERSLHRALMAGYTGRARAAMKAAKAVVEAGSGPVSMQEVDAVMAATAKPFADFAEAMEPVYKAAIEEAMRLGKQYILNRAHGYTPHEGVVPVTKAAGPKIPVGFGWIPFKDKLDILTSQGMDVPAAAAWMKANPKVAGLLTPSVLGDLKTDDLTLLGLDPLMPIGTNWMKLAMGKTIGGKMIKVASLGASVSSDMMYADTPDALAGVLGFAGIKEAGWKASGKPPPPPGAKVAGGPKKGSKLFELKPSFDVVDQSAVAALTKSQVFWVGTLHGEKLTNTIAESVSNTLIKEGLGRVEGGKAMLKALEAAYDVDFAHLAVPKRFAKNISGYMEGLAANTATVARTTGALNELHAIEVEKYQIVNPKDERTCPICGYMAGKEFDVKGAKDQLEVEQKQAPNEVKWVHPWLSTKQLFGPADKGNLGLTPGFGGKGAPHEIGKLSSAGFRFPPFHFKCRCTVDMSDDAEFVPTPVKVPEPPPPAPAPVPPPPPSLKPPPLPAAVAPSVHLPVPPAGVFPWGEGEMTLVPKKLSGAHEKWVLRAPDGSEWLFKPQQDFQTAGDVMTGEVARAMGVSSPDFYPFTSKGRAGSIQRMIPDIVKDLKHVAPESLTAEQVLEVQRGQVFDWLISQHDTRSENILIGKDGRLHFIDKGQTYRFLGRDKLVVGYNPNPLQTYYNQLWEAYQGGSTVSVASFDQLRPFIQQLQALPDDEFAKLLRPYAKAAAEAAKTGKVPKAAGWMGQLTEDQFIQRAIERKASLMADFETFYKEIDKGRKGVKLLFPPVTAKPVGPIEITRDWAKAVKLAEKSGHRGVPVWVGGEDIEGMHFLMYGTEGDGTWFDGKLRSGADAALSKLLGIDKATSTPVVSYSDPFWNDILTGVKHFNHHFKVGGDQTLNPTKVQQFKNAVEAVEAALKSKDPVTKAAAQHYQKIVDMYWDGTGFKVGSINTKISQFIPPPPKTVGMPKVGGLPPGWTMERVDASDAIRRQMGKGKIVAQPGAPVQSLADRQAGNGAYSSTPTKPAVKLVAPDGTTFFYSPTSVYRDGAYAQAGQLRIMVDPLHMATPERLESALKQLEQLGINHAKPTAEQMELLYLRKVTYKEMLSNIKDSASDLNNVVKSTLPIPEQIAQLKAEITKRTGITFPPGYNYMPELDHGDFGRPRWMAHYIKESDYANVAFAHDLQGHTVKEFFEMVLEGSTDDLLATTDRIRIGIPYAGGMSPERDMETGGAVYVFTRIRTVEGAKGMSLSFSGSLIRDLDALSYNRDNYGNTIERPHTRTARADMKGNISISSNEVCFKDSLSLNKWLTRINAGSKRDQLINLFKSKGIKEYGGMPIEELIK